MDSSNNMMAMQSGMMDNMKGMVVSIPLSPIPEILGRLSFSGFACANFKFDDQGQMRIFEINPRMGSSLFDRPLLFTSLIDKAIGASQ